MDSPPDTHADGITNYDEASAHCARFAASLGYPYVLFIVRVPEYNKDKPIVLTNFPSRWKYRYNPPEVAKEPLFLHMASRTQPFAWDDLGDALGFVPSSDPDPNFQAAWTVPLSFGNGFRAALSVAGSSIPPPGPKRDAHYAWGLLFTARMGERIKLLSDRAQPPERIERLTTRERQVLEMVAQGIKVKDVAIQLRMSKRSAEVLLVSAQQRLRVTTREQAIARAVFVGEIGLIAYPPKTDLFRLTGS